MPEDGVTFATAEQFRIWIEANAETSDGIWVRISKKGCDTPTVSHPEALEIALCYGWIDGQKKPLDDLYWLQRFCPRKAGSKWSKINTENAVRLIQEGRMTPRGLAEIERAKADGRWDAAYDSPKNAEPPEQFMQRLSQDPKALEFYQTLNRANLYAIAYRLQTAKRPETLEKRITTILEMMREGRRFH